MEFLTIQETASLLKVSPITIRRYIKTGRLQAVRLGRSVRVSRVAIEGFLTPATPSSTVRRKPFSMADSLWDIVGIGDSEPESPRDVARNKHAYPADAYADKHESRA